MYKAFSFKLVLLLVLSTFFLGCGSTTTKTAETKMSTVDSVPLRVACVGDSITEGYKLSNPKEESYPSQLSTLVAEGVMVKNFGIRGATVLENGNTPYLNTQQYRNSLHFNPEVVVIMLGTNDIKDINWKNRSNFVSDYNALIKTYKNLSSKPTIYICLVPPSYTNLQGITDKRITTELNPRIEEIAYSNHVVLIDIHTLLNDKETLFIDKIHPNKEGARQIAEAIYKVIY